MPSAWSRRLSVDCSRRSSPTRARFARPAVSVGAAPGTVSLLNRPYFLHDRGMTTLEATANFGDFDNATFSENVEDRVAALEIAGLSCEIVDVEAYAMENACTQLVDQWPDRGEGKIIAVADIGAGTGYFSFPMAKRVPAGRVLAVDIQEEMLDIIEARKADGAAANVETVLGTETDPRLPAGQVDLALIVDAYHEFSHPREMGEGIARALRPGGRLVLIEYRAEDPRVQIKALHKMSQAQAIAEMEAIGLEWERTGNFLPQQHFLVFRKPE